MLVVSVTLAEAFDEAKQEFIVAEAFELKLEHSLVSMSKWESNFEKPFLSDVEKTSEEALWYVEAMVLNEKIPPGVFSKLTQKNIDDIQAYIGRKMTATWFREENSSSGYQDVITTELIYYWMLSLGIPTEFQHWHFNRLMTLIQVCNKKNNPPKKRSAAEVARERRSLNEQRLAEMAKNRVKEGG